MDFKKIKKPDLSKIKKPDLSKIEVPDIDVDEEKIEGFFKNKKVLGGIAFILLIAISCGFYFLHWIRRPEYSIDIIRKAVAMRDLQTFSRHVDLPEIYNGVFTDATYGMANDADEFSRVIATGLNRKDKDKIVDRFVKMTAAALEAKKEDRQDLPSYGVIGKSVGIVCDTLEAQNPGYLLAGQQITSMKDESATVAFVFVDIGKRKNIVMNFLMHRLPDRKWKLVKFLNLRQTYQSAEYIFNEETDKLLKEEAEKNAKMAAEREKAYANFVVLSPEGRQTASYDIWKIFREKLKPIEDARESMYRFLSTIYADAKGKPALSIYNDFIIDKETGKVKNTAAFVLTTADKNNVEFDKIYCLSPSGGFVIDTALWEKNNLGVRGSLKRDEWMRYSMVFLTTTDGLGDVYKLLSTGNLRIMFYSGSKLLVTFEADDALRQSISDAVLVNDLVKNKLRTESGNYVITPLTEEMKTKIDLEIKQERLMGKKKSEVKNEKDGKDDNPSDKADVKVNEKADTKESASDKEKKQTEEVKQPTQEKEVQSGAKAENKAEIKTELKTEAKAEAKQEDKK